MHVLQFVFSLCSDSLYSIKIRIMICMAYGDISLVYLTFAVCLISLNVSGSPLQSKITAANNVFHRNARIIPDKVAPQRQRRETPIQCFERYGEYRTGHIKAIELSKDQVGKIHLFTAGFTGNGNAWGSTLGSISEGIITLANLMFDNDTIGKKTDLAVIASVSGGSSGSAVTFTLAHLFANDKLPHGYFLKHQKQLLKSLTPNGKEEDIPEDDVVYDNMVFLDACQLHLMGLAARSVALRTNTDDTFVSAAFSDMLYMNVWRPLKNMLPFTTKDTAHLYWTDKARSSGQFILALFGATTLYAKHMNVSHVLYSWKEALEENSVDVLETAISTDDHDPKSKAGKLIGLILNEDETSVLSPSDSIKTKDLITNPMLTKWMDATCTEASGEDTSCGITPKDLNSLMDLQEDLFNKHIDNYMEDIYGSKGYENRWVLFRESIEQVLAKDKLLLDNFDFTKTFCSDTVKDPIFELQCPRDKDGRKISVPNFGASVLMHIYPNQTALFNLRDTVGEENELTKNRLMPAFITDYETAKNLERVLRIFQKKMGDYFEDNRNGNTNLRTHLEKNRHFWFSNLLILVHPVMGMMQFAGVHEPGWMPTMGGAFSDFGFTHIMGYNLCNYIQDWMDCQSETSSKRLELRELTGKDQHKVSFTNLGGYTSALMGGMLQVLLTLHLQSRLLSKGLSVDPHYHIYQWKEERNFPKARAEELFLRKDEEYSYRLWVQAHKEFMNMIDTKAVSDAFAAHSKLADDAKDSMFFNRRESVLIRTNYNIMEWKIFSPNMKIGKYWFLYPFTGVGKDFLAARSHKLAWRAANEVRYRRKHLFKELDKKTQEIDFDLIFEGFAYPETEEELWSCCSYNVLMDYQSLKSEKERAEFDFCNVDDFVRLSTHLDYGKWEISKMDINKEDLASKYGSMN